MPFTGSHPAAILPLLGLPLPASALVIGSLAPDLPYYVSGTPDWDTHTATAIVTVDLLLGLLAWLAWHGLLAGPALDACPTGLRARVLPRVTLGLRARLGGAREVLAVVVALAVGAATHVGWDAFSHAGRFGTDHLAVLRDDAFGLAGYRWVQYASGVLGGLALLAWGVRWWRRHPPLSGSLPRALGGVRVGLAVLGVAAVAGVAAAAAADGARAGAFAGATRGGAAGVLAGVAWSLGWHLRRSRTSTR